MEPEGLWDGFPAAYIDCYPWDKNGYRPVAYAKVCHTGEALVFRLTAAEREIISVYTANGDPVYRDSCLEVFLNPCPFAGLDYINFELNPLGTILVGYGSNKNGRIDLSPFASDKLGIKTFYCQDETETRWGVELTVPYKFLYELYPGLNKKMQPSMRGNFFKSGADSSYPHYGCWNPIETQYEGETENFHQPAFFGELLINKIASC